MRASLLEMREVSFGFGGRSVLERVSFDLEEGSATALIGPNGAGKTTLLRVASGGLAATMGEVWVDGQRLGSVSRKEVARTVALVPQELDVPFDFTVEEIVAMGRAPYLGWLRGAGLGDRAAVDRAMGLADVDGLRRRVFNELSGGERQRVKIALGLAQEPKLLLLDEPTQNLDIGRQVEVMDLLGELRAEGITVFASMHDLQLVEGIFSSVLLLGPGRRWRRGTPGEMLRASVLETAFACPPGRHPMLVEREAVR